MQDQSFGASDLPPLISLFCGCGGLDVGFEKAQFQTLLALDKDPDAIKSYLRNLTGEAKVADLSSITGGQILNLLGRAPTGSLGVIGGPPCQYYSRGNVRPKPDDVRRDLPVKFAKLVRELDDLHGVSFFLFENVENLASPKHKSALARIKRALGGRFWLHQRILDAVDFGVPQYRQRFFLVGFKKTQFSSKSYKFPVPLDDERQTVRQYLDKGFPQPTFTSRSDVVEPNSFHINHWTMQPRSERFKGGINGANNSARRSFRVLDWDRPSWTVAYGNREVHIHPNGHRRLSIFEALLLQGFSDTFELIGSFSSQVTQVSNAVPPPLSTVLAISVRDMFTNHSKLALDVEQHCLCSSH